MSKQPVTAVIIGAGHRSMLYASYALRHPDEMKIVAVAEPDEVRRRKAAEAHGIPPERCFLTAEELAAQPRMADAAINGTMDLHHVPTTLPLLEAGYHVLLEKPICPNAAELMQLLRATQETGLHLMIGHVLRYAPFYVQLKQRVLEGAVGRIISMQTVENVSYHHMATAFVRGKWNRRDTSNPMLLAKCCHDLDLICWYMSGVDPCTVASLGGRSFFREECAPEGATDRCLNGCPLEENCTYSAETMYLEQRFWPTYAWEGIEHVDNPSDEYKAESLKTTNPYGRCVWRCDNDVVDHQGVLIQFGDGCVASHSLNTGTARPCRSIHILGTEGELQGVMEEGKFVIRRPDTRPGHEFSEESVDLAVSGAMHGGGDLRLVSDFVRVVQGEEPSISCTNVMDSVNGHLVAFAADISMLEQRMVAIQELRESTVA
ncbi:MAG: Gfo/Idh/MocA family oxidoreductase [Armatimonadetes bacterium]|nr:Gfo/Idh/MocA family oxidoreductase [Armatimonadota bacterium]